MASSVSVASAAASAMRSCALTDSFRTRRPIDMVGRITIGVPMISSAVSCQDVTNISTSAPSDVTAERTAIEKVDPKNVSISVMSAVSRDTASPVLSLEK